MNIRATSWACLCVLTVLTGGCNGCNGSSSLQKAFLFTFLEPTGPFQVQAGAMVSIAYEDDDPMDLATTSLLADRDGDPATTGDQIVIDANRPEGNGATQRVDWDTTGVPPGVYRILAVMTDGTSTSVFEAPGQATVTPAGANAAPTLALTAPDAPLTLARGACVPVSYVDDDPDDVAATTLVADADGDLGTAGDAIPFGPARPERDGLLQTVFWNSVGAGEGTWFLGGTTDDGVNPPVSALATGDVTLANVAYTKQAGGIPFHAGSAVSAFADGSAAVIGTYDTTFGTVTFGAGEPNETAFTAGMGAFAAGYGADGALAWARRADGGDAVGVAALPDGSCVVTGGFFGTITLGPGDADEVGLTSAGSEDLFLARFDATGTIAWALRVGGGGPDEGTHVAALPDGSFIVTGHFRNRVTFGAGEANETTLDSPAFLSVFVARFNGDGTLAWARDPMLTSLRGLAVFPDGAYALLTQGDTISRYDAVGALLWSRTVTAMRGQALAGFADGALAVAGDIDTATTFGAGEPNQTTLTPAGPADPFVARYAADGMLQWARNAGTTESGSATSIAALPDGSCVAAGSFFGTITFGAGEPNETTLTSEPFVFNPNLGSEDLFVARYLADGTLAAARSAGGGADDMASSVSGLPDCSFVATGFFSGTAIFGEGDAREVTLVDPQGDDAKDMFVARFNGDAGH